MAEGWTVDTLKQHVDTTFEAERRRVDDLRDANQRAVEIAMERSKEILELHNGLIRKMERDAATYITRGQVYAALATGLVVIGLLIAWMGVAN